MGEHLIAHAMIDDARAAVAPAGESGPASAETSQPAAAG